MSLEYMRQRNLIYRDINKVVGEIDTILEKDPSALSQRETNELLRTLENISQHDFYDSDWTRENKDYAATAFELVLSAAPALSSSVVRTIKALAVRCSSSESEPNDLRQMFSYQLGALSALSYGRGNDRWKKRTWPEISRVVEETRSELAKTGLLDGHAYNCGYKAARSANKICAVTVRDSTMPAFITADATYFTFFPDQLLAHMVSVPRFGDDYLIRRLREDAASVVSPDVEILGSYIYETYDVEANIKNIYECETTVYGDKMLVDVAYVKYNGRLLKIAGYDLYGACTDNPWSGGDGGFEQIEVYGNPSVYKHRPSGAAPGDPHQLFDNVRGFFRGDVLSSIGYATIKRFDDEESLREDSQKKAPLNGEELQEMLFDIVGEAG